MASKASGLLHKRCLYKQGAESSTDTYNLVTLNAKRSNSLSIVIKAERIQYVYLVYKQNGC
jgi:hypothetical protein